MGTKTIVAIDYDGTMTRSMSYPDVGELRDCLVELVKELKQNGVVTILWTCRAGKDLDDAVTYLKSKGVEFDYINEGYPPNVEAYKEIGLSPKIGADIYYDDKNFGFSHYVWGLQKCIADLVISRGGEYTPYLKRETHNCKGCMSCNYFND